MHGMSMGREPALSLHNLLFDWDTGPFAIATLAVLVLIAAWYLRSTARLEAGGHHWSGWRTASFLLGLLFVEVALGSPVAVFTNYAFTAHASQHMLLMLAAPPFAALGAPMTLLLQSSRRSVKTLALRALHSRPFALISHPVVVFFLYYLSMYAFFLTGAVGYAMEHMWLMDIINLGFLGGATLFWWPMVGVDPDPRGKMSPAFKFINLCVGIPAESFLGIALMVKTTPVAAMYTLASTHTGGGILWASGDFATIVAIGPIFFEWSRSDARRARRIDARIDAGEADVATVPVPQGVGMSATLRSLRRG